MLGGVTATATRVQTYRPWPVKKGAPGAMTFVAIGSMVLVTVLWMANHGLSDLCGRGVAKPRDPREALGALGARTRHAVLSTSR